MSESRTLKRGREIRAAACGGESELQSEGRQFQEGEEGQAQRAFPWKSKRKHEKMSGRKSSPGRSAESWFTPSLAKPEMEKDIGRRRARS